MILTKKLEAEILEAYHTLWDAFLSGDIKTFASCLDNKVLFVGSAEGEVFTSRKDAAKFYQATAHQMTGKADFRKRRITIKGVGNTAVINEQCDLYVLAGTAWIFYGHSRVSAIFEQKGDSWKIVHIHISLPDSRTEKGDQIATEKIQAENLQLREAVKRRTVELEEKNRELEIESALEKVRTVALAMKSPEDMLRICTVISQQLSILGLQHIRNVQTAIFYPDRGRFMNYEYYTRHDKTIVTEVDFTAEKSLQTWAKKMMQGAHIEFYEQLKGKKLREWHRYLQTSNMFADEYVLEAKSLNYYSHSLGPVTLILSTYSPITPEESRVFKRFLNVFEIAYKRYLEIEKAHIQAREAQTELALERIRAKVTAMMESSDLLDIVVSMRKEFVALGHEAHYFWYMRWLPDKYEKAMTSGDGTKIGMVMTLPRHIHGDIPLVAEWEKGTAPALVYPMDVDAAIAYVHKMVKLGNFIQIDPQAPTEEDLRHINGLTFVMARTTQGEIGYSLPGVVPNPPAADIATLVRFAGVFDLAYRRFEDLQDAEKETGETQIELALERVRSRGMGMQKSEELKEVIQIVYDQMVQLKLPIEHTGFIMDYKHRNDYDSWIADHLGSPSNIIIPYFEALYYNCFNETKQKGLDFFTVNLSLEEKNKFYHDLFKHLPGFPEDSKAFIFKQPALTISTVLLDDVALYIENFSGTPYNDEENGVLMRFGKVFQQTYTRFLDLQKAEAQAREAQVEAALERVRSKTMAMHNSHEVGESVATLFEELVGLGVLTPEDRCGIGIMLPNHQMEAWTAAKTTDGKAELTIGFLDMTLHPLLVSAYQGWVDKKEVNQYLLQGEDRIRYYEAMLKQPNYKIKRDHYTGAIRIIHNDFYFKEGCLYVFSERELPAASLAVYTRFAAVFGQTYRRYLDLQKAEAQAREAQVEAALESIRSKAMAMRTSEDIAETTAASFAELKKLGIASFRSGVGILTKGSRMAQVFADTRAEDGQTRALSTMRSMDEHPALQQQYTAWEKQEDYEQFLSGDELITYYSHPFFKKSNIDLQKISGNNQECGYYFAFPDGLFYAWSHQPYSEDEKNILRRFRNIISLTFRRYLDLQKAEAQAREATRQASLDRVRAVIASMRSTEDLELITPLIFKELTILGVPFIRCGVFIIHEDRQIIDAYLSSPSGTSLGVLHLPYQASELTIQTVEAWRNGKVHRQHWSQADFIAWTKQMMDQHQIESSRTYQGADTAPESLDLHFVPFAQGMLYVGSLEALGDQDLETVLALARSFSIAYARYEDFVKLEMAKADIESTLTELRATQTQLIQSEKMASLGELTAGIAHEIQNPLNFVNNFSEVNTELSAEILEAAEKGDLEEVKAIAADIRNNQEKIAEHGKRADSIVKSMLQHSRSSSGAKEPTDLNKLADEYLRLAYHGFRAKDKNFNTNIKTDLAPGLPIVPVMTQDLGRVLLNLFNNALYAVNERKKTAGEGYAPEVRVASRYDKDEVVITVSDNGPGIPDHIREKIFQPFFTTKPTGQGTGLGLSLSYDIVKAAGGAIRVDSEEAKGTSFTIILPNT